ncbi:hypothetical protein [Luteibacter sp. 3190]|uniref:hypothetical protein n=1 Tax=Luteibacter sp. 3190 TaxID=2817736 RepID=UPI002865A4D9|nr:hypothetical protein [Luteibacter sp. 3190]MDR6937961.1 hypothetical protein [Luteibacter sp. 3190]
MDVQRATWTYEKSSMIARAAGALLLALFTAYDANHSLPASGDAGDQDPVFWQRVNDIASRLAEGEEALRGVWPGSSPSSSDDDRSESGAGPFSPSTTVTRSELRQRRDGRLAVAVIDIGGRCVSRGEVLTHYPGLELRDTPRPDMPDASKRVVWSANVDRGSVVFSFADGAPGCLRSVSFSPD